MVGSIRFVNHHVGRLDRHSAPIRHGIAALTAKFTITCSFAMDLREPATDPGQAGRQFNVLADNPLQHPLRSPTTRFRLRVCGSIICRRLKLRAVLSGWWRARPFPGSAAHTPSGDPRAELRCSSQALTWITVNRLLKSWAIRRQPAMASIFCDWRNCSSSCTSWLTSVLYSHIADSPPAWLCTGLIVTSSVYRLPSFCG